MWSFAYQKLWCEPPRYSIKAHLLSIWPCSHNMGCSTTVRESAYARWSTGKNESVEETPHSTTGDETEASVRCQESRKWRKREAYHAWGMHVCFGGTFPCDLRCTMIDRTRSDETHWPPSTSCPGGFWSNCWMYSLNLVIQQVSFHSLRNILFHQNVMILNVTKPVLASFCAFSNTYQRMSSYVLYTIYSFVPESLALAAESH